jgi:hypothetical protein
VAEKIILAMIGPLTAAIFGTLIIGLFVGWITRRTQDRRASYELRRELISQMTETASALFFAITHYRRVKEGLLDPQVKLMDIAPILHEQYRKTRTAATVLENRLEAYFDSDTPRQHWHATIDLLAVRYYDVLGQASDDLRVANAGNDHSGLTAQELADPALVTTGYKDRMHKAAEAVRRTPLSSVRRDA